MTVKTGWQDIETMIDPINKLIEDMRKEATHCMNIMEFNSWTRLNKAADRLEALIGEPMTDFLKMVDEGYTETGHIMRNQAGEVALVELGVVRKMSLDEFFQVMHVHVPREVSDDDLLV
jgi:hypothetical protein